MTPHTCTPESLGGLLNADPWARPSPPDSEPLSFPNAPLIFLHGGVYGWEFGPSASVLWGLTGVRESLTGASEPLS